MTDERIVELYSEAELAVVPSLYEGFSLPAIEAMCSGTPLVATDGGALPEVTGNDGETVFRCRKGDAGDLATTIKRALANPELRAAVGEAGRRAGDRALDVAALRRAHRRAVPRGAGDAAEPRQAAPQRAHLMLTIRFDELGLRAGDAVLDVGSGFGRHVYECARRGARVVALDYAADEVIETRNTLAAMVEAGEIAADRLIGCAARRRAMRCPFPTTRSTS